MFKYKPDWSRTSTANGYRVVRCEGHPRAWKKGSYVYVHRIVAEIKLGRLLRPGEVAHHIDEDKLNNSPENIEVLSKPAHTSKHSRRGRTMSALKCMNCGESFEREKRKVANPKRTFCSKSCAAKKNNRKDIKDIRHGTYSSYKYWKCRCQECRSFMAGIARKRRSKASVP